MKKRTAWILVAGVAAVAVGAAAVGMAALVLRGRGGRRRRAQLPVHRSPGRDPRAALLGAGHVPGAPPAVPADAGRQPRPRGLGPPDHGRGGARERAARLGLGDGAGAARRASPASASRASRPTPTSSSRATRSTTSPRPARKIYAVPTAILDITGLASRGHVLRGHARQARRGGAVRGRRASTRTRPTSSPSASSPSRTASRWRRSLDALFGQYVAAHRQEPRARRRNEVKALIDNGPYDAAPRAQGRPGGRAALRATRCDERLQRRPAA